MTDRVVTHMDIENFKIDPAKLMVDAFIDSLNLYKHKHGAENVQVVDSEGYNIQRIRPNGQLIELMYLDNEQNELSRFIYYTNFDLRIGLITNK